jgi:hypothetical protein
MITARHQQAIRTIYETLKDLDITWTITGSLGFALHGMDVGINDIDLQTDKDGAYRIEHAFRSNVIRKVAFSEAEGIRSHFGELSVREVTVEMMGALQKKLPSGEWEPPVDVEKHREFVDFEGMRLPVLSLSYEEQAYRQLGRTEKADEIRQWLTRRST